MRIGLNIITGGLVGLLTAGCHSRQAAIQIEGVPEKPKIIQTPPANTSPMNASPAKPVTEQTHHDLKLWQLQKDGIDLTILSFDRRNFEMRVIDQAKGPGSEYGTSADVGKGAIAAVNAGFFTPEGVPIGILATRGERRGVVNRSSFLGAGFFTGPEPALLSRSSFLANQVKHEELLQTGPRLVWPGVDLKGLKNKAPRPRCFLLWDGADHFAIGHAESATLAGLSKTLKSKPMADFKIKYALNLDGGRSADLWISSNVKGGPVTKRGFFNRAVRNHLVLRKK